MAPSSADTNINAIIRRLAATGAVWPSRQVQSDLLSHQLLLADICDAIVDWIDANERVKPTVIHSIPGRAGQAAYEMKPRINNLLWYLKVCIDDQDGPDELMAILSAHPDH